MTANQACGCWYRDQSAFASGGVAGNFPNFFSPTIFLPRVDLQSHTTILSTTSRTTLNQKFINDTNKNITDANYTFPLFDGISVVSFTCKIGDSTIVGVVKERHSARKDYESAVARGESAGLFVQSQDASDVFQTRIGNIPAGKAAEIRLEYIGELKHDAELDGVRFTIPTFIAARYGQSSPFGTGQPLDGERIEISVDVVVEDGAHIQGLSSPSHPIAMKLGQTSTQTHAFRSNMASTSLSLGSAGLNQDFILIIHAQGHDTPRALLEHHPSLPGYCALMTTLVPKFNLPNHSPEIVFVVDRSGSMEYNMPLVIEALKLFLKSLPYSAKFNICSFGYGSSFMFDKSTPYDEEQLLKALRAVDSFQANFGGTETLNALRETVKNRLPGVPLEIMLLTDGEIWDQQSAFDFINQAAKDKVRVFSLGIGPGVSTAFIEGLARAGNGFAQAVKQGERIDKRIIRMLKAALSPHVDDYHLAVNYASHSPDQREARGDDDFVVIGTSPADSQSTVKNDTPPISLFDSNFVETATNLPVGKFDHLPALEIPKELQAPHKIGGLFPFSRTSVYMLLPKVTRKIESVTLCGSVNGTPLRLNIAVQDVGVGSTIHQLAAKRAMLEIEEGRGWLSSAVSDDGRSLKEQHAADWSSIVEREATRLGVEFQIAGKFCSFVAVERTGHEKNRVLHKDVAPRSSGVALQAKPSGSSFPTMDFSTLEHSDVLGEFDFDNFLDENMDEDVDEEVHMEEGEPSDPQTFDTPHTASSGGIAGRIEISVPSRAGERGSGTGSSVFGSSGVSHGGNTGSVVGKISNCITTPPPFSSPPNLHAGSMLYQTAGNIADRTTRFGLETAQSSRDSVPLASAFNSGTTTSGAPSGTHALQDYHMQLMLLEQTNKKRMMMARQEPSDPANEQNQTTSGSRRQSNETTSVQRLYMVQSHQQQPFGQTPQQLAQSQQQQHQKQQYMQQQQQLRSEGVQGPLLLPASLPSRAPGPAAFGGVATFAAQQTTRTDTAEARMHRIIALQQFDGSWEPTEDLLVITGVDVSKFRDPNTGGFDDDALKATALALAWLEKHMFKEKEVWEMVSDKARKWIGARPGVSDVDALIRLAIDRFL